MPAGPSGGGAKCPDRPISFWHGRSAPFELLAGLLGRRTDDPGLIELHRTYPLKPFPAFTDREDIPPTGSDAHGFELTYQATARAPGCYPSIRVRGRGPLLGYLTKVWIPCEAITFGSSYRDADPQPAIARIAEDHFGWRQARTPQEIIDDADSEYSDLMDRVDALSMY